MGRDGKLKRVWRGGDNCNPHGNGVVVEGREPSVPIQTSSFLDWLAALLPRPSSKAARLKP